MKNQAKMFQTKEQDKSPETNHNEEELYDLPDREFKIIVIKIFTEVKRPMHEQCENCNRDRIHFKNQTEIKELKNIVTALKISIEGYNGNYIKQKKRSSCEHEDRLLEIIQSEKQKGKRTKKSKEMFRNLWDIPQMINIHEKQKRITET